MRTRAPRNTVPADLPFSTHRLGAFDSAKSDDGDEIALEIPADLTELSDADLAELNNRAVETFNGVYGDGSELNDDDLTSLAELSEGITALKDELSTREEAAAERREKAAELAAKVNPADESTDEVDEDEDDDEAEASDEGETPTAETEEVEKEAVTASGPRRKELRVPTSRMKRHLPKTEAQDPLGMRDVVFASGEGSGFAPGTGLNWGDAAKIVDKRLASFNATQYSRAAQQGRHMRQQQGVMSIRKPIPENLVIESSDAMHAEEVLRRAADESRLPQQSLVASGGWCAPSETLYDLLEMETRDGLFSLPEVGISRGGIFRTLGPSFADIYSQITGFQYTEEEDIAGDYDGSGGGSKPVYRVECPDFEEFRLGVVGMAIVAGLLQQRGYPEVIARTLRGALVAHDHRMAALSLQEIAEGSTDVTMSSDTGATAPLLDAIEKQIEHMKYTHRLGRGASVEAIFPYWVRGAVRSDLSRRLGVDLISVPDARIDGWFRERGANPQFVYNFQDINGTDAASFTQWPSEVQFLLYPAGSWVRGTSDIITVDTVFDSTQLRQNDYTALFTEEGHVVIPMGHDSRAVTVPLDPSGATYAGTAVVETGA